jgi:hypothetical protein
MAEIVQNQTIIMLTIRMSHGGRSFGLKSASAYTGVVRSKERKI